MGSVLIPPVAHEAEVDQHGGYAVGRQFPSERNPVGKLIPAIGGNLYPRNVPGQVCAGFLDGCRNTLPIISITRSVTPSSVREFFHVRFCLGEHQSWSITVVERDYPAREIDALFP
jgi:hypothetical protein